MHADAINIYKPRISEMHNETSRECMRNAFVGEISTSGGCCGRSLDAALVQHPSPSQKWQKITPNECEVLITQPFH